MPKLFFHFFYTKIDLKIDLVSSTKPLKRLWHLAATGVSSGRGGLSGGAEEGGAPEEADRAEAEIESPARLGDLGCQR